MQQQSFFPVRNTINWQEIAAVKDIHIDPKMLPAKSNAHTRNVVLNSLPENFYFGIKPFLRRIDLKREQFIYQQEDDLRYLYFPESSMVAEYKTLDDGRMVEIASIGNESVVGLSGVYGEKAVSPYMVQVLQEGSAYRIETPVFYKALMSHPQVHLRLYQILDTYFRQISEKMLCNMFHLVKERMCTWLLTLQDRCELDVIRVSHEQIACSLGAIRPSVTCIMTELREMELIDYKRCNVTIKDRAGMQAAACGCYQKTAAIY